MSYADVVRTLYFRYGTGPGDSVKACAALTEHGYANGPGDWDAVERFMSAMAAKWVPLYPNAPDSSDKIRVRDGWQDS